MKLNIDNKDALKTNATPVSKDFSIGDSSIIVEILRNKLYSHPIRTLVQEYLCNARDAHREAKQSKPIYVTFPNDRTPVFKVRDFGPGLSPERVEDIFVKYGSSTKRSSNNETGGFGIGAKSAWAYTDSFTVISYHNGTVYHYIAHIANKSTGTLDLISKNETDAPNGLEIQIAVKHHDILNFVNAAIRATFFWNDSEQPDFSDGHKNEADTIFKSDKAAVFNPSFYPKILAQDSGGNYLVVDGIPYEPIYRLDLGTSYNYPVCVFFNTGELEVAASREAVSNNETNQRIMKQRAANAYKDLYTFVKNNLEKCTNVQEFFRFIKDFAWFQRLDNKKFVENGELWQVEHERLSKFPERFKNLKVREYSLTYNDTLRSYEYNLNQCSVSNIESAFVLDDSELPIKNSKRFKQFVINSGGRKLHVLFSVIAGDAALMEFASKLELEATSTIPQPERTPRAKIVKDENEVCVNIYRSYKSKSTDGLMVNIETNTKEFVYIVRTTANSQELATKNAYLGEFLNKLGINFCFISESTSKKIQNNDKFFTVDKFFETLNNRLNSDNFKQIQTNLASEVFGYMYFSQELIKHSESFIDLTVKNGLNALKEVQTSDHYPSKEFNTKPFRKTLLRNSDKLRTFYLALFLLKRALRKYPLLKLCSEEKTERSVNDIVFYINSKYNQKNG